VGQEIESAHFRRGDFHEFTARLREETALLARWFAEGRFASGEPVGGFELEAWLVDAEHRPAPVNEIFLERLGSALVVPELARFNVEVNATPHRLTGDALTRMRRELEATLAECDRVASGLDVRMMTIGILPTVEDAHLSLPNMSSLRRYRALNEQVLRLRGGRPLILDIVGREHLKTERRDVMLESAATSLQLHLQVDQVDAPRIYNAARIVSAPMVAACANAPYLFGKDLWDETRIPLFEQSVAVTGAAGGQAHLSRVNFGHGYARQSLLECFQTNVERYDVLLPKIFDGPPEEMAHLRLHNGTIWRWNRPLIGFDPARGAPHLRIEHRVAAACTSVEDTLANAALFFGLVHSLAARRPPPEALLDFSLARENFYAAARWGLEAEVTWLDGRRGLLLELLIDELLPLARLGLQSLELDARDIGHYLGIMEARLKQRRTGTAWQRAWVSRHGPDMQALTEAYLQRQRSGAPVHDWSL